MVENIFGKGENAGQQQFCFLPQCLQKAYFSLLYNMRSCDKELTLYLTCQFWALRIQLQMKM